MGLIELLRKDIFRNVSFQYNRSSRPGLAFWKAPKINTAGSVPLRAVPAYRVKENDSRTAKTNIRCSSYGVSVDRQRESLLYVEDLNVGSRNGSGIEMENPTT